MIRAGLHVHHGIQPTMKKQFHLRTYYVRARLFGYIVIFLFVFYIVYFFLSLFQG